MITLQRFKKLRVALINEYARQTKTQPDKWIEYVDGFALDLPETTLQDFIKNKFAMYYYVKDDLSYGD